MSVYQKYIFLLNHWVGEFMSTLIKLFQANVIYEALCFDATQGRMNGAPNETRTHSYRFASQAC